MSFRHAARISATPMGRHGTRARCRRLGRSVQVAAGEPTAIVAPLDVDHGRAVQDRAAEVGSGHGGVAEIRAAEIGTVQVRVAEAPCASALRPGELVAGPHAGNWGMSKPPACTRG